MRHVALHFLELVELQARIRNGEEVAAVNGLELQGFCFTQVVAATRQNGLLPLLQVAKRTQFSQRFLLNALRDKEVM